jgi:hypothetical protein
MSSMLSSAQRSEKCSPTPLLIKTRNLQQNISRAASVLFSNWNTSNEWPADVTRM